MPAISRIRFTNVIYENGAKRYNDEVFLFDGHNAAFLLENGGGKTVFIQTALQAVIPHINMAERKIKDTLSLENAPAHIAIEWIINDKPRRYAMTAVSLYIENNALNSLKYTYDYDAQDNQGIEDMPFAIALPDQKKRPATRGEISDYYSKMSKQSPHARVFSTIQDYGKYIENTYKIIPSEWRKVATINSGEGNVDEFFNKCKTTEQLLSHLLIPVVEEAIEGDHATGFVETFERQRDHFKKNRALQDKIEQSRLIKEKIDDYIDVYGDYEKERIELQALKQEAKTVTNYVKNQLANKEEELKLNADNLQVLIKDQRLYDQEKHSYDWLLLKEEVKELEKRWSVADEKLGLEQEVYDSLAARKQNIEMTSLNKDLLAEQAQMDVLTEELSQIETLVEMADVKKELEENSCNIKGQYVYELELIDREIKRLQQETKELDRKKVHLKEKLYSSEAYEKDLIGQKSQLEATLSMIENNQVRLKGQLFGDGPEVALSLEGDRLLTRAGQIAKDIAGYDHRLDELVQFIGTKTKAKENLLDQKVRLKEQLSVTGLQLSALNKAMDEVRVSVETAGYPLFMKGNIYGKESSILRELEEQQAYALNVKEKAIRQERISLRQFDVYEDLSHYVSEPLLEQVVTDLKEQVEFVELGSQFIVSLKSSYGLTPEDLFERFPFWSFTLVTSVKDIETVRLAVTRYQKNLRQMVVVISREEAHKIARGQSKLIGDFMGNGIYPDSWKIGMEPDRYYEWQQSLRSMANDAIENRRQKEGALSEADHLLKHVRDFFTLYPYDRFEALKNAQASDEKDLKQVMGDLQALDIGIKEDQDSQLKVTGLLSQLNLEAQGLRGQQQLIEQMTLEKQSADETEARLNQVIKALDEVVEKIEGYQESVLRTEEEVGQLREEGHKFMGEKDRILGQELYQEVKDFEPYGTNASLESLKEHRLILKNKLSGLSRTRLEVEERIREHQRLKERYSHEYQKKEREAQYPVVLVDVYYSGEAEDLYDKLKRSEQTLNQLKAQSRQVDKSLTQIKTRCQMLEETLLRDYGSVVTFDVDSPMIEQRLRSEKATLSDRKRKLAKEKNTIEVMMRKYDLTYRELEIKDGTYHYMAGDIVPLNLDVDYFNGFDESPDSLVRELLSSLEGQYAVTQKQEVNVKKKQGSVMQFCHETIRDRRLLETLAIGLNSKNDYQALLVYQEKMTEIIMKIIQVAEDDKRESDLELQTFLAHLMTYVKSVAQELDAIQGKTKITMGDEVKQIFVFDIPAFDEEKAKIGLRNYIDETIHYYEKESLHEDVSDEKLRQSLSDRLSVMRLLEVVMEEQSIKIKCRKVTNDMKINKAPMTWESSNKWSGGEKWSKNMTLFLSILNYLAEKKQHLSPNQKKQRSVILDNPFGKASSDHVLKPVFMIAEKLGFQIIALTAHAEGKFISDYFPVVYSCRLRPTIDPGKQIMTNEKILNHTYLREHAPMTLMRLQEVEQMTLF